MKTPLIGRLVCVAAIAGCFEVCSIEAAPPLSAPEYLALDGTPSTQGNPFSGDNIKAFSSPVLRIYRTQSAISQGTVLLFPGGGYRWLAMKWEGEGTAAALTERGFDVAILEYHVLENPDVAALPESTRMAKTRDLALDDALKAYRLIRTRGSEWKLHLNRLAVMGYSAGGHLAARTVQNLHPEEQPADLVLIYPAYLDKTRPGQGGPEVVPPGKPSRLYVLFGDQDNSGWIKGCQDYVAEWDRAGGKSSVTLLPGLGHGFGASRLDALGGFFQP